MRNYVSMDKVNKIKKFLWRYLRWIQDSFFEGELTDADLEEVKSGLKDFIDERENIVVIYTFKSKNAMKR